jgi:hypothetical protein
MKVTLRDGLLYGFLGFYILYGFTVIGTTGLLMSLAIGLIVLSFEVGTELSVAAVVLSGVTWKLMNRRSEGFNSMSQIVNNVSKVKQSFPLSEGFEDDVETFKKTQKNGPSGVLSSSFTEGFADAETSTTTPSAVAAIVAAPAKPTEAKKEDKPAAAASAPAPVATPAADPVKSSGFSDKAAEGMFKLGSIPADTVGGAHIDIGTTMMNALNALKPDQVKQMTDDTRNLMETQKSLMGMLSTMKPMLNDGKQLMNTFNDMFGKGGPVGTTQ